MTNGFVMCDFGSAHESLNDYGIVWERVERERIRRAVDIIYQAYRDRFLR